MTTSTTVSAIDVKKGDIVTGILHKYRTRWRQRAVTEAEPISKVNGQWPTVTDATYMENGEGGEPTVYLELSDAPGWSYCLAPDAEVTVVDGAQ